MRNFFDDYGCIICGKESRHHSNAMCFDCHRKIRDKLAKSVKRHSKSDPEHRLAIELFRQEKLAKKLLSRYCHRSPLPSKIPGPYLPRSNPVYEALSALPRIV